MVYVTVVRSETEFVAVRMTQDSRHFHTVYGDSTIRVDTKHLTDICGDFTRFLVHLLEVHRIGQTVLANLELNPTVVARTVFTTATTPRFEIPRHCLNGSNCTVSKFADPTVKTSLSVDVVPVITVSILADKGNQFVPVGSVIVRLNIAFQRGVICPGAVPQHTFDRHFASTLVTGRVIDTLVNSVYVYDDGDKGRKLVLTFNISGQNTATISCSDIACSAPPSKDSDIDTMSGSFRFAVIWY